MGEEEGWEKALFSLNTWHRSCTQPWAYRPCQSLVMWPRLTARENGKCSLQLCGHLKLQEKKSDHCMTTKYLCYTSFSPHLPDNLYLIFYTGRPILTHLFFLLFCYDINCRPSNYSEFWLNVHDSCKPKALAFETQKKMSSISASLSLL